MATCKKCPAQILWCKTPKGKWIPVDVEPNVAGNLRLENGAGPDGETVATVVGLFDESECVLYMPHHATCPNVGEFRK